jgi:hypothetical protein
MSTSSDMLSRNDAFNNCLLVDPDYIIVPSNRVIRANLYFQLIIDNFEFK